jgi:hypothetical protein
LRRASFSKDRGQQSTLFSRQASAVVGQLQLGSCHGNEFNGSNTNEL